MKNDKKDAEAVARLAKYQDIKISMMPEPQILALRMMTRECYALSDMLTEIKNRFCTDLYLLFPGFLEVFSGALGKTALAVLKSYPSPKAVQNVDPEALALLIAKTRRKSSEWASKKIKLLQDCAQLASSMPNEFLLLQN